MLAGFSLRELGNENNYTCHAKLPNKLGRVLYSVTIKLRPKQAFLTFWSRDEPQVYTEQEKDDQNMQNTLLQLSAQNLQ